MYLAHNFSRSRARGSVQASACKPSNVALSRRHLLAETGVTLTAPLLLSSVHGYVNAAEGAQSVYDYSALMYEKEVSMSKYKGQVLVIVNVASE